MEGFGFTARVGPWCPGSGSGTGWRPDGLVKDRASNSGARGASEGWVFVFRMLRGGSEGRRPRHAAESRDKLDFAVKRQMLGEPGERTAGRARRSGPRRAAPQLPVGLLARVLDQILDELLRRER